MRMVHKYIQKIKVDRFTRLTPVWEDEFVEGSIQDNLFAGLGTSSNTGYQVDINCHDVNLRNRNSLGERFLSILRKGQVIRKRTGYQYNHLQH